jgi:hypothetical protein
MLFISVSILLASNMIDSIWKARLLRMPLLERQAVLLALHEVSSITELHPEHFERNSPTN